MAGGQTQRGQKHGECTKAAPACDLPEAVFFDDTPLTQVLSKDAVKTGSFYFDYGGDRIAVRPGGCGIMLIDQGRVTDSGGMYKTRDNSIHQNDVTFEDSACAGGVSDTAPDNANYAIVNDGNNRFDANVSDQQSGALSLGASGSQLGWAARGWVGAERPTGVLLTRLAPRAGTTTAPLRLPGT